MRKSRAKLRPTMDTLDITEYKRIPKLSTFTIKKEVNAKEFLRILQEKPEIIESTEITLPSLGSGHFGKIFITINSAHLGKHSE